MPKNSQYNNGNVQYELLIRSNTIISNLGIYEPSETNIINNPKAVEISKALNNSDYISKFYVLCSQDLLKVQ